MIFKNELLFKLSCKYSYQNVSIIYIWSPNLVMSEIAKIDIGTLLMYSW